jgi:hypothetical protein
MYAQIPVEKDRNKNSQKMFVESETKKSPPRKRKNAVVQKLP